MEMDALKEYPKCTACGKCVPCPAKLNIPLLNRYYEAVLAGDETVKTQYMDLERTAKWCAQCGRCDGLCPEKAQPMSRMWALYRHFGA